MDNIITRRVSLYTFSLFFWQSRQLTVKLLIFLNHVSRLGQYLISFDYQYHKSIYLGIVSLLPLFVIINQQMFTCLTRGAEIYRLRNIL